MKCWRITKYNPQFRNKDGIYLKEEWTSFHDIGKNIAGIVLTKEDYTTVENAYINTILTIMGKVGIQSLMVESLERSVQKSSDEKDANIDIREGSILNKNEINILCRLILREMLWCKLIYNGKMFVHFGYDYYMYIGVDLPKDYLSDLIYKSGLFLEEYQSPYY